MPPQSITIKHPSKLGKLNEVGKIFPYLVDLNKYNLITTISFIIDDIEAIQSFQNNGSNLMGVLYGLTLKIISQYSINHLFPSTKKIIVEHIKD